MARAATYRAAGTLPRRHRRRGADGAYRWHRGRVTPLRGPDDRLTGRLGTAIDVEDQKRGEEQRDRLLAEATAIFEAAGDGLYVFDGTGHLRRLNAAVRQHFAFEGPLDFRTPPCHMPGGTAVRDETGQPLAEAEWPLFRVLRVRS